MKAFAAIFAVTAAFLFGAIPTAYLLGRAKGIDIRRHGSGNVGSTNVSRVMGKPWGLLCLGLDALKGWVPATIAGPFAVGAVLPWLDATGWQWACGLAAILGHVFSPFMRFKGGKGVATSLGVMLAMAPLALAVAATAGGLIIWTTGYVSLASVVGAALIPATILILAIAKGLYVPWSSIGVTSLLAVLIAWRHRANLARIRARTEPRFFDRYREGGEKA